jgi:cytochrome c oxidase subunit 3
MATTEALSHDSDTDSHDHGDHPAFLAHHFDTPEQQYDSGKLGMWLFLVTEVLFFSGLFCAYAIFRALRPEVFSGSSVFLNTKLGAINTGVLLFSSLTMAWGVRCAQLEEHKRLTGMLAATISCAMIFLGVKAVEYSHKFDMGLLPGALFSYDPETVVHHEGISKYLVGLSVPFFLVLCGLATWYVIAAVGRNKFQMRVSGPLTIATLCYFVGVGLGMILESGESEPHVSHVQGAIHQEMDPTDHALVLGGDTERGGADVGEDGVHDSATVAGTEVPPAADVEGEADASVDTASSNTVIERMAQDATNTGIESRLMAEARQQQLASGRITTSVDEVISPVEKTELSINNPYLAGTFFSIYYCMTGIHAIHILAGIGVLAWLLVRSVRRDFNRQYFGPVDYVGLYWHIVDLIWIYLFPLLYLIR